MILIGDAFLTCAKIGGIVIPILIFVFTYASSYRSGVSVNQRIGCELRGVSLRPLSNTCPNCGSSKSTLDESAQDQFLVNSDRICSICETSYTRPLPAVLSWGLVVFGVALFGGGLALGIHAHNEFRDHPWAAYVTLLAGVAFGSQSVLTGIAKLRVANGAKKRTK